MLSKLISEAIRSKISLYLLRFLSLFSTNTSNETVFGRDDASFFVLLRKVALKSIKDQFDGGKIVRETLISSHALRYIDNNNTAYIDSTTSINANRKRKQQIPLGENWNQEPYCRLISAPHQLSRSHLVITPLEIVFLMKIETTILKWLFHGECDLMGKRRKGKKSWRHFWWLVWIEVSFNIFFSH